MLQRLFTALLFCSFTALPFSQLQAISEKPDLMRQEIQHVVVLVLENRSFDSVLGWLYSHTDHPHFIPSQIALPFQGLSDVQLGSWTNLLKNTSGELVYSCSPIQGTPSTAGKKLINSPSQDPNEPFDHVTNQIFGYGGGTKATMLGFLQDFASLWNECQWTECKTDICAVMETYTSEQLPVLYGLARHYAVSDLWFSSVPTQTNPNRAFLACGTSEGQVINGWFGKSVFQADTIWNRLEEEAPGTSWTIFWQTDMLPFLFPGPFTDARTFTAMSRIPHLEDHYQRFDLFHELARQGKLPEFSFIEPQWTFCEAIELAQLKETYPNFQMLAGIQGNDMHPPGDVRTAENLLANIYTSLIANTEAWNKTLLVILFDEHGGLFDHIPPPASIAPDDHFEHGFAFDRYGVRIPALFISPRIQQNTVIRSDLSVPFDHTSLLSTLLKWKQVDPAQWNMGKRVAIAPTFERVVTETTPRRDPMISPSSFLPPQGGELMMGEPIVLKDQKGLYLSIDECRYAKVDVANNHVRLMCLPNGGTLTHGSFVLLTIHDPSLAADNYVLDSCSLMGYCWYNQNTHSPGQWWTIKSVDFPYLGYEIKSGDRIYLESHIYLDPLCFVPCRLAPSAWSSLDGLVTTKAITDEEFNDCIWTIESLAPIPKS
ncbi:MAG: hypothetical protein KF898_06330 [Parachlamydiales bacterium]|nr:hypothetical protein [Candidatus Acheromyda pituitae]